MKHNIFWIFGLLFVITAISFLVRSYLFDIAVTSSALTDVKYTGGMSNKGRISFINQFGWEVDPKPVERVKVDIPKSFDNIFHDYNSLQLKSGMDLTGYKGMKVTRYTYKLLNHPIKEKEVRVNLYVHKNQIIAADVSSVDIEGFMHSIDDKE